MLIGIAGKTGSGKNYIASKLEERGWRTLDLDRVAHQVLDLVALEVEESLGPGVLTDTGRVDRAALGQVVFGDPSRLRRLEEITYPRIEGLTQEWIAEQAHHPAAVHAINLHKTDIPERCDFIIWVHSPFLIRRRRVMKREGRPWKALKMRFHRQRGLNAKIFSRRAETFSVGNFGNGRRLEAALDRILSRATNWEGNNVDEKHQ